MLMAKIEEMTEGKFLGKIFGRIRVRGIIRGERIIIAMAYAVFPIIVIFEEGAILAIIIKEKGAIRVIVVTVGEANRVIDLIEAEEGIRRILIVEREDIKETAAETGVEIGAEVTSETHTRQCQRK
jgi:hypothetical protein